MSTSPINVDEVVDALGGDVSAAQFFEITRQAISKFRKQGYIPNARLLHLKAARPDLFESEGDRRAEDRRHQDDRRDTCPNPCDALPLQQDKAA